MSIYHGQIYKHKLIEGMRKACEAILPSYGPTNKSVVMDKEGKPYLSKDGYAILEHLIWSDKVEDTGLKFLQMLSEQTMKQVGDGTSVTTIFAYNLMKELNRLDVAGCNMNLVIEGVHKAKKNYFVYLSEKTKPVASQKELQQIVYNSCREERLTNTIIEAASYTGDDGIITIEEGKETEDKVVYTEGYIYDKGYLNSKFMNKPETFSWEAKDVRILIYTDPILVGDIPKLLPIVSECLTKKFPLLIIAGDMGRNGIELLLVNNKEKGLKSCVTQVPEWGDLARLYLEDIAVYTGATIIDPLFNRLDKVTVDDLGFAGKVKVNKESTYLFEGGGDEQVIESYIELLKKQMTTIRENEDKETYVNRIAKLSGGITTVFLGGITEQEMIERKMRAEDAVSAMQAASRYGSIPSVAYTLNEISNRLNNTLSGDKAMGYDIFKKVLKRPVEQLFTNNYMFYQEYLPKLKEGQGFDFEKNKIVNMRKTGLIDSAQVAQIAIENASSMIETLIMGNVGVIE